MTTLADVLAFITNQADAEDCARIVKTATARSKSVRNLRAATIRIGDAVSLDGLSPKALNGMSGEVETIKGVRANVWLDARSTKTLWFANIPRYIGLVQHEDENFLLRGVPLSCLTPAL